MLQSDANSLSNRQLDLLIKKSGRWALLLVAVTHLAAMDAQAYDRWVVPPVPWSVTWTDAPGGSTTFQDKNPVEAARKYWAVKKSTVDIISRCYANSLTFPGMCQVPPNYSGLSAAQYICPAIYTHTDFGTPTDPICFHNGPPVISGSVSGGVSKFCPVTSVLDRASEECVCPEGMLWVAERSRCYPVVSVDISVSPKSCQTNPAAGNPIFSLTGVKRQSEHLDFGVGWLDFALVYNNEQEQALSDASVVQRSEKQLDSFGGSWSSNFHRFLLLGPTTNGYDEHTGRWGVRANRGGGAVVSFVRNVPYESYRVAGGESRDSLVQSQDGS